MGAPLKVAIQAGTPLGNGCTVEFVALDPTSGSEVTGVTVTNSSIYFDGGPGQSAGAAPFTLIDPKLLHTA